MASYCDMILGNHLIGDGVRLSGGPSQSGDRALANLVNPDPDLSASLAGGVTARFSAAGFVGGAAVLMVARSVNVSVALGSRAAVTIPALGDHAVMRFFSPQVSVSSVTFTAAGLARFLIAGPRFRAAVNIRHGSTLNLPPRIDPQVSPAGTVWMDYPRPRRVADVEWPDLTRAEARELVTGAVNAQAEKSLVAISLYSGAGGDREGQASFIGYISAVEGPYPVISSSYRARLQVVEVAG